jgi:predicted ATPase
LTSLHLAGWKSIRDAEIELRPLNVLIGANGAGKSNLVGFFELISAMMAGRFQEDGHKSPCSLCCFSQKRTSRD